MFICIRMDLALNNHHKTQTKNKQTNCLLNVTISIGSGKHRIGVNLKIKFKNIGIPVFFSCSI